MKNLFSASALLLALPAFGKAGAQDWPCDGADAGRSNSSPEELATPLAVRWTWRSPRPPAPAWPASDRLNFDRAFHPVVAQGLVFFGSSADDKIRALDAASGRERWSFFTEGPVRLAPAFWKDRLFAASDDGCLYCLKAATGELLWKRKGGPDDRMTLGNDRMISLCPARGGPVVADGVVYFAAGIWPSEGTFLYALDADSGKVLWCNDRAGTIRMGQPHPNATAESGVAAQGHLAIAGDLLLVPTGRAVPAAFRRSDGAFQYFRLQENGQKGGGPTLAAGRVFFNSGMLFDSRTGSSLETVGPGALALSREGVVRSTEKELVVSAIVEKERTDREGAVVKSTGLKKMWSIAGVPGGTAVVTTKNHIITAASGSIAAVDAATHAVVWKSDAEGAPLALAVSDGHLYAATDRGILYCFGEPGKPEAAPLLRPALEPSPYGENKVAARAAEEILEKSGVTEGCAVDLACGEGALAHELARRTKLKIFGVDKDPAKVAAARRNLEAAGLYGSRVSVHLADPARILFPRYVANLVVSDSGSAPDDAVARLLRPWGGVSCLGPTGGMKITRRGPLEGAGAWTHSYADPANTSCSSDQLVRAPLSVSWFREGDFEMPQRHGRGPPPLFLEGKLFVEGLNAIRAVDAYNGRDLWEASLPQVLRAFNGEHLMGSAGTGGNLCATREGVFVHTGKRCLRLDPATGRTLAEYETPPLDDGKPGTWGYLASENGALLGTVVNPEHVVKWRFKSADMNEQYTESSRLFALDVSTGRTKWMYKARASIRHNAIAVEGGRVFLIDRPAAEMDRIDAEKGAAPEQPKGDLVALDLATGKEAWRVTEDIFGTLLIAGVRYDALLMAQQPTAFGLPSEKGGRMAVFRASDGKRLWDKKATYRTRPILNDRTIYAQGGSWDLLSGEEEKFDLQRSYGCGQLAASTHLVVYRSATLGYHEFASSRGTTNYGGVRLGCWINAIPAGGLVLVPDATTGCRCSYLNQAWFALQPRE